MPRVPLEHHIHFGLSNPHRHHSRPVRCRAPFAIAPFLFSAAFIRLPVFYAPSLGFFIATAPQARSPHFVIRCLPSEGHVVISFATSVKRASIVRALCEHRASFVRALCSKSKQLEEIRVSSGKVLEDIQRHSQCEFHTKCGLRVQDNQNNK